jgi:hypothetical protein
MTLDVKELRDRRKFLYEASKSYGHHLKEVTEDKWPAQYRDLFSCPVLKVFRSEDYLVTVFEERPGVHRISACRAEINNDGSFKDGIEWMELQRLKNEAGYEAYDAVEIFPAQKDLVNVSNMRHLWVVLDCPELPITWRNKANEPLRDNRVSEVRCDDGTAL